MGGGDLNEAINSAREILDREDADEDEEVRDRGESGVEGVFVRSTLPTTCNQIGVCGAAATTR